jgi:M6 family metalloprotease-like protein
VTHAAYRLLCLFVAVAAVAWVAGTDSPDAAQGAARADPAAACVPPVVSPGGVGEGRNDPLLIPPTVGEVRIGMLFVDFADVRSTADPGATYEAFVPGAVGWYRNVSYERLQLVVTPLQRRLTLGRTAAHYRTGGGAGPEAGLRSAFEEAIAAADAEVDFSRFQALYLVAPFAALGTFGASGVVILERALRVDGAEIRSVALLFDGPGAEPDYLAHETGHILGLPDLYVIGSRLSFHRWDIMASSTANRGLFAWHRWKLGWLDPEQIVCIGARRRISATLTPLERPGGTKAIVLRRGRYAYVTELRQPVAAGAGRVCKGGVLIYQVEFGAASGVADIRLLRARGDTGTQWARCGPLAAAPFGRGRGEISRVRAWGLRFEITARLRDGSFRIRVTKTR